MNIIRNKCALFFVAYISVLHAGDSTFLKNLDSYIEKGMNDWGITGIAVGIVKDNKTVYARGFGKRIIDSEKVIDENSVFAIGSNSKLMTATALGILVQKELITWDSNVIDLMPDFKLKDPYVTREITVKDLLSHRAGLPREDFLWYGSQNYGRKEIIHRLRFLEPAYTMRGGYIYQNMMFLTAGELIPAVTGQSWDEFLTEHIFTPLGMVRSVTSVKPLKLMENVAQPHIKVDGKTIKVPYRDIDNVGPAGSVNSSVTDMIEWMKLHLNSGNVDGNQIVDSVVVDMIHTPHNPFFVSRESMEIFPSTHFRAYGLGVGLSDYHGRKLLLHTGGIDGMLSLVGMVPNEKLGIVILTNYSPNNFRPALFYHIIDEFFNVESRGWNQFFLEETRKVDEHFTNYERIVNENRKRGRSPDFDVDNILGSYTNDAYGTIEVSRERRELLFKHWGSSLLGDLEHWNNNTYRLTWRDPALSDATDKLFINFYIDSQSRIKSLRVELIQDIDIEKGPVFQEVVFKRDITTK